MFACLHLVAHFQSLRSQNITFFPIGIIKQRHIGRTVGIVLDRSHACRDIFLISLKIDNSIALLMSASLMSAGDVSIVIAAASTVFGKQKRLGRFNNLARTFYPCQGFVHWKY